MPGTVELKTERLLLRQHIADDASALHERFGKDVAMFEYSGWNPYATEQMAAETVARYIESYGDPRFYGWAIEHDGRLVGTIGAYDFDSSNSTIEIGMSIERASWGKGFATEALAAVLPYLAHDERIATITAWCASSNIGSARALEKAGMALVDIEKGALQIDGTTYDKLCYEYQGG